jgi:hypothetical protein
VNILDPVSALRGLLGVTPAALELKKRGCARILSIRTPTAQQMLISKRSLRDPAPAARSDAARREARRTDMKRRDFLAIGGMTLVGATLSPASVRAQTPKRGG